MGGCCAKSNIEYLEIGTFEEQKEEINLDKWPELSEKIKEINKKLGDFKWEEPNVDLKKFPIQKLQNGSFYQGQWEGKKRQGICQEIEQTGDQQLGQYQNNKKNGQGRWIKQNGECSEGQFKDDYPFGDGIQIRMDGMKQEGKFDGGGFGYKYLSGKGKQTAPDKSVQEGEFKAGQKHGEGKITLGDGSIFQGTFENNEMINGTMEWPDKTKQIGEFLNKKFHGRGQYIQPNGKTFEGNQEFGVKNGLGVLKSPDGLEIRGTWNEGTLHGKATMIKGKKEWEVLQEMGQKKSKKMVNKKESASASESMTPKSVLSPNSKGKNRRSGFVDNPFSLQLEKLGEEQVKQEES